MLRTILLTDEVFEARDVADRYMGLLRMQSIYCQWTPYGVCVEADRINESSYILEDMKESDRYMQRRRSKMSNFQVFMYMYVGLVFQWIGSFFLSKSDVRSWPCLIFSALLFMAALWHERKWFWVAVFSMQLLVNISLVVGWMIN